MNDQHRWNNFKSQMAKEGVCTNFAIQQLWIRECAEAEATKKFFDQEGETTDEDANAQVAEVKLEEKISAIATIERMGRQVSSLAIGLGDFSNHSGTDYHAQHSKQKPKRHCRRMLLSDPEHWIASTREGGHHDQERRGPRWLLNHLCLMVNAMKICGQRSKLSSTINNIIKAPSCCLQPPLPQRPKNSR